MLAYDDGLGSGPFGAGVSLCVNDEIAGACEPGRVLRAGDLVTADLVVGLGGWHADAARSWVVGGGGVAGGRDRLSRASAAVTRAGVGALGEGVPWDGVARAMEAAARREGVVLLRGFDGHGIGRAMHEGPRLPGHPDDLGRLDPGGLVLRRGMVVTVEPVVGWRETGFVRDGWLDRTGDGADACYHEVTVGVGARGSRVLAGLTGVS